MLSVSHRVANDLLSEAVSKGSHIPVEKDAYIFKEDLENTTSLLVDETRDTLDTTTAGKTTNSRLGDALDVVTKDLAMALSSTPLSKVD